MPHHIEVDELLSRKEALIKEYEKISTPTLQVDSYTDTDLVPFLQAVSNDLQAFPNIEEIENRVKEQAKERGVWIGALNKDGKEKGDLYNTMFGDLHPRAAEKDGEDRMFTVGYLYAVLFYIDDIFGNDTQNIEQESTIKVLKKIFALILQNPAVLHSDEFKNLVSHDADKLPEAAQAEVTKIAIAFQDILLDIHTHAPMEWLTHFFYPTFAGHLLNATTNQDKKLLEGLLLTIQEYCESRILVSGMNLFEMLAEYATKNFRTDYNNFIEEQTISTQGITEKIDVKGFQLSLVEMKNELEAIYSFFNETDFRVIEQLNSIITNDHIPVHEFLDLISFLTLSVAAEWNDVMSLFKELGDEGSIYNIVAIACLTKPEESIPDMIEKVSLFIDIKTKIAVLLGEHLKAVIAKNTTDDEAYTKGLQSLENLVDDLLDGMYASNFWQKRTQRYEDPRSLIQPDKAL